MPRRPSVNRTVPVSIVTCKLYNTNTGEIKEKTITVLGHHKSDNSLENAILNEVGQYYRVLELFMATPDYEKRRMWLTDFWKHSEMVE